jgi:hypothetical protein
VMNAVLLHFLPVPNAQQLVYFHLKNQPLSTSQTGYGDMSMSLPVFEASMTFYFVLSGARLGTCCRQQCLRHGYISSHPGQTD